MNMTAEKTRPAGIDAIALPRSYGPTAASGRDIR